MSERAAGRAADAGPEVLSLRQRPDSRPPASEPEPENVTLAAYGRAILEA